MRKTILLITGLLWGISAWAQPDIAAQLRNRYDINKGFETSVTITIDIPGITAPPKTVQVRYEKGKAPKIKGAGLILMPKKGFLDQFSEILALKVQWIDLVTSGDIRMFKLVALDPASDWITADLKVNTKEMRIDEVSLATRESGTFLITHSYGSGKFPDRSVISFETDKFSIPLKFLGKSDGKAVKDTNGKVKGKIILDFGGLRVF